MELSHAWGRAAAVFDDPNLVSAAGLVPVLELAEQSGLSDLLDEHVTFTSELVRSGAANPDTKVDVSGRRAAGRRGQHRGS